MHRYKRILCFVGGSDPQPGLTEAAELAARSGAALTLLDVLPESTEGPWLTVPGKPDLERLVVTSRLHDLREMAAPIEARGVEVGTEVTTGSPRIKMPRAEVELLLSATKETAQQALEGLLKEVDLRGVRHEVQLAKGIPSEVVTHLASESDLAVMGTVSRSGIAGILIGNTAESVLRRIECSILAVKPREFQTPLRF